MKKTNRILPFTMAQKLSAAELAQVSAAGTSVATSNITYGPNSGTDIQGDINIDM